MATNLDQAFADLERRRAEGMYYPPEWRGRLTTDEAYALCLRSLDRRIAEGDALAGWKVGLTNDRIRLQYGVHEPVFGYVLASGVHRDGARLHTAALVNPAVEFEVGLRIARRVPDEPALDDVWHAVRDLCPAIEVVEVRGNFADDVPLALADNAQQKGVVLGSGTLPFTRAFPPGADDWRSLRCSAYRDAQLLETSNAEGVQGGPLDSVLWLARTLARFGRHIEAGHVIMTGSLTRQYAAQSGQSFRAEFPGFGTVSATFD